MHRPLPRLFGILLILLSAFSLTTPASTAAQQNESSPSDLVEQLPGLQSAIARRYVTTDFFAGFPIPTPSATIPEDAGSISRVEVTVLEFDSAMIVTTAFGTVLNDDLVSGIIGGDEATLKSREVPNLGDRARFYSVDSGHQDSPTTGFLVVQDGNLALLITARGESAAIVPTVRAFADYMLAAEPGTGTIVYGERANSTGGTFDLLPTAADGPFLGFLIPMYDYDLLNLGNSPIELPATPPAG